MFIGLDNSKKSIIFNLVFSGLILIFGLFVIGFYYDLLNSDGCGRLPMMMVTINTGVMVLYLLINICLLFNEKFDPRVRKKIKKIINVIRWISLSWHIVFFSISLTNSFPFNTSCQVINNLVGVYLTGITLMIGLELLSLALALITLLVFVLIIIILACCGYTVNLEGTQGEQNDPGTPYFSRTTVDTFKNLLGLGLFGSSDEEEINCPICLEEYTEEDVLRKMPCDHYFHQDCIDPWMEKHSDCPICKQNIRDGESKFNDEMV